MTSLYANLSTAYGTGRNTPAPAVSCCGNPKPVSEQPVDDPNRYADFLTLSNTALSNTAGIRSPENSTLAEMKLVLPTLVMPTNEVRTWALGISDELAAAGGSSGAFATASTRSNKLVAQAQAELSEKTVGTQIAAALKQSGITLADHDRLDFAVNEKGDITVKNGITDTKKKAALESILNGNTELKSNLIRYEAQKQFALLATTFKFGGNASFDPNQPSLKNPGEGLTTTFSRKIDHLIYNADAVAKGMKTVSEMTNVVKGDTDLSFTFSYQKGQVFQGETLPEDRVFSNRVDSLGSLTAVIGLDESAGKSVQAFIAALESDIEKQSGTLQEQLNAAMQKAGLGDAKKKITFAADENGKIVVEGNIRKDQKAKLERIINADNDLAGLLKNQRAKQDVLAEMKASVADTLEAAGITDLLDEEAVAAYKTRPTGFDLTSDKMTFAREQLLTDYMNRSGVSLTELRADTDGVFDRNSRFGEIAGLRNEVEHFVTEIAETKTGSATPLSAMKRGELVEAGEEPDFTQEITALKKYVTEELLDPFNEEFAASLPGMRITDYQITMDDKGRAVIEVQTEDGKHESIAQANKIINAWFNSSNTEELGKAILEAHDDEHGDVQEYRHRVVIDSSADGYKVESPEADKAALAEMSSLAGELSSMFDDFFRNTLGIQGEFSFQLSPEGKLTLADTTSGTLSRPAHQQITDVLNALNERLLSDDPLDEKSFASVLPSGLAGAVEKVLALQEAQSKLHDPAMQKAMVTF